MIWIFGRQRSLRKICFCIMCFLFVAFGIYWNLSSKINSCIQAIVTFIWCLRNVQNFINLPLGFLNFIETVYILFGNPSLFIFYDMRMLSVKIRQYICIFEGAFDPRHFGISIYQFINRETFEISTQNTCSTNKGSEYFFNSESPRNPYVVY